MWQNLFTTFSGLSDRDWMARIILPQNIILELQSEDKDGAYQELINTIIPANRAQDRELCFHDVFEREKSTSTFLGYGVAMPHGISKGTETLQTALGIKRAGIRFPDGGHEQRAKIVLLCLCPLALRKEYLHFIFLAANILLLEENRKDLLNAGNAGQVREVMLRL